MVNGLLSSLSCAILEQCSFAFSVKWGVAPTWYMSSGCTSGICMTWKPNWVRVDRERRENE